MKIAIDKQVDFIIALDLFIKETGHVMSGFTLFFDTLIKKHQPYFEKTLTLLESGIPYHDSITYVKPFFEESLFPYFLLLGKHPNPEVVTHMMVVKIQHIKQFKTLKQDLTRYPKLLFMLLGLLFFMYIFFLLPLYQNSVVFEQLNHNASVNVLLRLSEELRSQPLILVYSILIILSLFLIGNKLLKRVISYLKFHIPIIKSTYFLEVYMNVTFSLFALLKAKIYMIEALELTKMMVDGQLEKHLNHVIDHVLEGKSLDTMLHDMPHQPKDMKQFMKHVTNEQQLIDMLFMMSKRYEDHFVRRLNAQYKLLSPILLFFISLVILAMFYMIYVPIFEMYDSIL